MDLIMSSAATIRTPCETEVMSIFVTSGYRVHAAVAAAAGDDDKSQSINTSITARSQQVIAGRQSHCASECPSAISAETRAAKLVSF